MKIYNYGRQHIDQTDIDAVVSVLQSDFLTQGPTVAKFEHDLCEYTGAKYCVVVANATVALHLAMVALGVSAGDEVITSPNTFLASANCVLYVGGTVQFADVEKETANISITEIEKHITSATKAIIPVHFAGQSCDMETIYKLAKKHSIAVVEDAAHAIGSNYKDTKVGSCAFSDMTVFSFHPVKTITTGEGGAITTNNKDIYEKLKLLRSHGMHREKGDISYTYEMRTLGFNARMTDIQASLGIEQLRKLDAFKQRRREIVSYYNSTLGVEHLEEQMYSNACFHLYPILVSKRDEIYTKAKEVGLNLQVHYIPVHTQPYYKTIGYNEGDFPVAEAYYKRTLSLPLYPDLTDSDIEEIVRRMKHIL